jgi:hypothetical protein
MALSTIIALLQEAPAADSNGSAGTIRIVAGILALVLVGIIVMRRKGSKKKDEDEF